MTFLRCLISPSCRTASTLRFSVILGLALAGFVFASAQSVPNQQQPRPEEKTLPLNPLDREDKAVAERLARSDRRIRELVGEANVRLVLVQLVALKPESASESARPVRHAEVVLFQPQGEVGARALINLASSAVEQVIRLDGSQVPMTSEDLADAFQLALRNEEVLKILGPTAKSYQVQSMSLTGTATPMENSVTGLRIRSSDEHDPCFKHRCLQLAFRHGRDFLSGPMIIADLTAKRVYVERKKQQ